MNRKVELIWLLTSFIAVTMPTQSSGEKLYLDYQKQKVEAAEILCHIDSAVLPNKSEKNGKATDARHRALDDKTTTCRVDTTVIPNKPVKNGKVTDVRFYTLEEYERLFGLRNPSDEYFDTIYYVYCDMPPGPSSATVPSADGCGLSPLCRRALPHRELLSVKTNVLFDFAYVPAGYNRFCPIPNIAVEYYPLHGHFTFGASLDFPWWKDYDAHKYMEVRNYQLEGRYYFESGDISRRPVGEGPAFRHWYVSAYVHTFIYSVCINAAHGYEGEGIGAGVGTGYVLPLGHHSRWRLELGLQVGFFRTRQDPYQWLCPIDPDDDKQQYYYKWYGNASTFKRRQHRYNWFGPTRIGITFSYDLFRRKPHVANMLSH